MSHIVAILFLLTAAVSAEDKIWSALVYASNPAKGEKAAPLPAELAEYTAKLKKHFGYEQFEVLGSATKSVGAGGKEKWLVPSPTFQMEVQALKQAGEYKVDLDLFQGQKRIVKLGAQLGMQSPLFISGPRHGKGQLIVVFEIRP